MEAFVTCGFLGLLALWVIPIVVVLVQRKRLRRLQASLDQIGQRVSALEMKAGIAPGPAPSAAPQSVPPPIPTAISQPTIARSVPPPAVAPVVPRPKPARSPIDWEAFLGVKLIAWIGGFALFLGVALAVKYSFQQNLITPLMRVVFGGLTGLGLIAGGWFAARRNYPTPGQTLCATGLLVLYASAFAAHAFYGLFSMTSAFLLMSATTLGAFGLAVGLNAQAVVVLGLLGGFCTPPLLTSAADHPGFLFGYVALLNAGVAAVVLRKRWDYLLLLAALGTVLTEAAWVPITDQTRAGPGFFIFLGLQAQFLAIAWLRQRQPPPEIWSSAAAALAGFSSLAFGFWLLSYPTLAREPVFFFGFNFLAQGLLLALALLRPNPARLSAAAGGVLFLTLSGWTAWFLSDDLLWWGLAAYLVFALFHAGFTVWPRPVGSATRATYAAYIPLLALLLLLFAVGGDHASFAVWSCIFLVNAIALALAWSHRSVPLLITALILTMATAGLWILSAPPPEASVSGMLAVAGGFGLFFAGASLLLTRRSGVGSDLARRHVPALAAAMPFVLLLMVVNKLPLPDPLGLFAVALVLAVVLLGLGILARTSWIALVALLSTWAVERAWLSLHFAEAAAPLALGWFVLFFLLFVAYPFFASLTGLTGQADGQSQQIQLPWAIGALAGPLHFWLIYEVVAAAVPSLNHGLLPALFILPYALGVWHLIKKRGAIPATGDARLAWQGGAAAFFLSLAFPIQFEREWITIGWALEGFALLLLFRVVPHAGLRVAGTAMLALAFARLALNPAVLEYHPRAAMRIWNWYLYAYGLTILSLFGGAFVTQKLRETKFARFVPAFLYTLGTILSFLLLNIEIADFFSVGPTLTFSFEGNFARDMTYSIAWALFALVLLLVGMSRRVRAVRYAGLALLAVTLLKLFFHDIANLGPLFRIGAFIGVSLVLIVASFVYQRFFSRAAPGEQ